MDEHARIVAAGPDRINAEEAAGHMAGLDREGQLVPPAGIQHQRADGCGECDAAADGQDRQDDQNQGGASD